MLPSMPNAVKKGTLLASGFIAGGALMGVVSAAMRFGGVNLVNDAWLNNTWSGSTGTGCLRYPDILSRQSFDENEISCGDTEISS